MANGYKYEYGMPTLIIEWLQLTGLIPKDQVHKRANMLPNTNLNPDAIKVGYLAEVAYEWDLDGPSQPLEFVNMLKFETRGTAEKNALSEILSELSVEALS